MITREDLRELSRFRFNDNAPYAVSFYFQPGIPRNKAHSDQLVYAKDLVRDGMREVLSDGKNACAQTDLERILTLADRLNSEAKRAKAIMAEADVPVLPSASCVVAVGARSSDATVWLRTVTDGSDAVQRHCAP